MRWLLLLFTLFAWMVCFTRHSAGALGIWLLLASLGSLAAALAFAQARIAGNPRAQRLSDVDLMQWRENRQVPDRDRSASGE